MTDGQQSPKNTFLKLHNLLVFFFLVVKVKTETNMFSTISMLATKKENCVKEKSTIDDSGV